MEYEVKSISAMPPKTRQGGQESGLSNAIRHLAVGQALFVKPNDGETVDKLRNRLSGNAARLNCRLRMDRPAGGVWIYRDSPQEAQGQASGMFDD